MRIINAFIKIRNNPKVTMVIAIFKAFHDIAKFRKDGEYGWVSVLSASFQVLYANIHLAYASLSYFLTLFKSSPKEAFNFMFKGNEPLYDTEEENKGKPSYLKDSLQTAKKMLFGASYNTPIPPSNVVGSSSQNTLVVDVKQNGQTVATENFNLGNSTHRSLILQGV